MKKTMVLFILMMVMVIASGCGVTHSTEINRTDGERSIENISQVNKAIDF